MFTTIRMSWLLELLKRTPLLTPIISPRQQITTMVFCLSNGDKVIVESEKVNHIELHTEWDDDDAPF